MRRRGSARGPAVAHLHSLSSFFIGLRSYSSDQSRTYYSSGYRLGRAAIFWRGCWDSSYLPAVVCASVFPCSSWIYLHFASAHITFVPTLYLPWILSMWLLSVERRQLLPAAARRIAGSTGIREGRLLRFKLCRSDCLPSSRRQQRCSDGSSGRYWHCRQWACSPWGSAQSSFCPRWRCTFPAGYRQRKSRAWTCWPKSCFRAIRILSMGRRNRMGFLRVWGIRRAVLCRARAARGVFRSRARTAVAGWSGCHAGFESRESRLVGAVALAPQAAAL